jgi:Lipid A 3-O-deacylase (PagL)
MSTSRIANIRKAIGAGLFLVAMIVVFLAPRPSRAEEFRLLSVAIRASVSGATVLGDVAPEEFQAYDAVATFGLPWGRYSESGWGVGTRLMASAGALRGAGENALVVSLIPLLAFGSRDGRFTLDAGIGGALLSKQRFETQDFGGPFQFALTVGVGVPLYKRVGVSYRFLHYSDAAIHGSHTTGADLHTIEFIYRF